MAHHNTRRAPPLLGVPSQSRRLIHSEGPLEEEAPFDFSPFSAYEYLPIQSHQVRLLTLCGGPPQMPIICRLQIFDFSEIQDNRNRYNALSYSCKFPCILTHHVIFPPVSNAPGTLLKFFRGQRRKTSSHSYRGGRWSCKTISCQAKSLSSFAPPKGRTQLRYRAVDRRPLH
jgi:hypothetical protein